MRPLTFLLIFVSASFLIACETQVDIHIEGEESAVVFGFLDPTLDTQFVKITHTFLTDGSAFDAAQIQEMSEYNDLEAYVIVYDGTDSVDSYLLLEKTVTDKDSGVFYYPAQTVYYFTEAVNNDYTYKLSFFGSGKEVESYSDVIGEFTEENSMLFPIVSLVVLYEANNTVYKNVFFRLFSSENTKRYEFSYLFHYKEIYLDGSIAEKTLHFKHSPFITESLLGNEFFEFRIDGLSFYIRVAGIILDQNNEENIDHRVIGKMDYIFEYAGEELNNFIVLETEPFTSWKPEHNPYSNITNGIGVWSSRGKSVFEGKTLSNSSIKEMVFGQYTGNLKFCSDDPAHNGTSLGCN